jgi:hypothetical protein
MWQAQQSQWGSTIRAAPRQSGVMQGRGSAAGHNGGWWNNKDGQAKNILKTALARLGCTLETTFSAGRNGHRCAIQLPNSFGVAEGVGSKKKDSEKASIEEGCRMLDAQGVLRGRNLSGREQQLMSQNKPKKGGGQNSQPMGRGRGGGRGNYGVAPKKLETAVRRDCEQGNLDNAWRSWQQIQQWGMQPQPATFDMMLPALIRESAFDRAMDVVRVDAGSNSQSLISPTILGRHLLHLPQYASADGAYNFIDEATTVAFAATPEPQLGEFFRRQCLGIALEFIEEASSALAAVGEIQREGDRQRPNSSALERMGKAKTGIRLSPGVKKGELMCNSPATSGSYGGSNDFVRGLQSGDTVGLMLMSQHQHFITHVSPDGATNMGGGGAGGSSEDNIRALGKLMVEASVVNINPLVIKPLLPRDTVRLQGASARSGGIAEWRVDKLANRTSYNRQLKAIATIVESAATGDGSRDETGYIPLGGQGAGHHLPPWRTVSENEKKQKKGKGRPAEWPAWQIARAIALPARYSFEPLGGAGGAATAGIWGLNPQQLCAQACTSMRGFPMQGPPQAPRGMSMPRDHPMVGLNSSQQHALSLATTQRLTLVQGPPGTGKTATSLRILKWWVRSGVHGGGDNNTILATSDSNTAVDNLLEALIGAGIRAVRLGRPEAIRPELLKHCLSDIGRAAGDAGGGADRKQVEHAARMRALRQAEVVCATCVGVGSAMLAMTSFAAILVDEATQATEPATLVAIASGCRQLVLVGDQCQLPPTVTCQRASEDERVLFGTPLFSRLAEGDRQNAVPTLMLDTQYRMHPAISRLPAHLFYGGKLLDGVTAADRPPLPGFPWPRQGWPVAFVPITLAYGGSGENSADGGSKQNESEAHAVVGAVEGFMQAGLAGGDLAVVTPYGAQVRLLRRLLRQKGYQVDKPKDPMPNPQQAMGQSYQQQQVQYMQQAYQQQQQQQQRVEVSSVDGFQGREKQLIIFSAVRSNRNGSVGFLADWRRVNVAFTRPKRGLVVFGDPHTLEQERATWGHWLQWVKSNGLIRGEGNDGQGDSDVDRFDLAGLHCQHPRKAQEQRERERRQRSQPQSDLVLAQSRQEQQHPKLPQQPQLPSQQQPVRQATASAGQWVACNSEKGVYYYNNLTGATSWTNPAAASSVGSNDTHAGTSSLLANANGSANHFNSVVGQYRLEQQQQQQRPQQPQQQQQQPKLAQPQQASQLKQTASRAPTGAGAVNGAVNGAANGAARVAGAAAGDVVVVAAAGTDADRKQSREREEYEERANPEKVRYRSRSRSRNRKHSHRHHSRSRDRERSRRRESGDRSKQRHRSRSRDRGRDRRSRDGSRDGSRDRSRGRDRRRERDGSRDRERRRDRREGSRDRERRKDRRDGSRERRKDGERDRKRDRSGSSDGKGTDV